MNTINKYLFLLKNKLIDNIKIQAFYKIIPLTFLGYGLFIAIKYKDLILKNPKKLITDKFSFDYKQESNISKKLYPLIKYKNINKLYSEYSHEYILIKALYSFIINFYILEKFSNGLYKKTIKLKDEVFLIKSDKYLFNILPNGVMLISDQFYYNLLNSNKEHIKDNSDLHYLLLIIIHNLIHNKESNTSFNLNKLYSKVRN